MNDESVDDHFDDIKAEALEQCEEVKTFHPRQYQLQILEQARIQNSIAFLDTGTGKTYIAIMLLQETKGKSVFLAPTRALVLQQGLVAQKFNVNAGIFQGRKYDTMGRLRWKQKLQKFSAFFFTPQLFLNVLRFGFLRIDDFALLIFDECHWCFGQHPYNNIMREFLDPLVTKPKIFGMTASPVTSKVTTSVSLVDKISELANNLYCGYAPVDRASVDLVANKPQVQVERFTELQSPLDLEQDVYQLLLSGNVLNEDEQLEFDDVEMAMRRNCGNIYNLLGGYAFAIYLKDLQARVSSQALKSLLAQIARDLDKPILKSSRVKRLFGILSKHFTSVKPRQAKAIIFTERRITAYYLNQLLQEDPDLSEHRYSSDVVVGLNSDRGKFDICRMKDCQQEMVIHRFRDEEINILVATSVAEEGLDIPSCDLVIRFESFSSNLRSYVQSRGRARQTNSKFYLLLEERDDSIDLKRVEEFDQAIEFLKTLADLGTPIIAPRFVAMDSYTVPETGARVSINWSCQYLLDICNSIPSDLFTEKKEPKFVTEFYQANKCPFPVSNPTYPGYLGIIRLPAELKELEEFATSLQPTANDAKAAAALQALSRLHTLKFLNDNLRPSWLVKKEIDPVEPVERKVIDVLGELLSTQSHTGRKSIAALPQDQTIYNAVTIPGHSSRLYVLKVHPEFPEFGNRGLAIVSAIELNVTPFKFYPGNLYKNYEYPSCDKHGKDAFDQLCTVCTASTHWLIPQLVALKNYTETELSKFKVFHFFLFSNIMQLYPDFLQLIRGGEVHIGSAVNQSQEELQVPLTVVPWDFSTQDIDWSLMYSVVNCVNSSLQCEVWKPLSSFLPSLGTSGYIVQSTQNSTLFITVGKCVDGIDSLISAKWSQSLTVKDYYSTKYQLDLPPQDVLQVRPLGKFKNAFWPIYHVSRRSKDAILLPVQLLTVFPIPLAVMNMGRLMPVVYTNLQRQFIYSKLEHELSISSKMLQQALTCTAANEEYDYQRLETLGDTVLKFRVTKFLFLTNPDAHEGMISQERENCTSNQALYNVAMRFKLYRYMQVAPVTLRLWVPPGLQEMTHVADGKCREDEEASDEDEQLTTRQTPDLEELLDLKRDEDVIELDFSDTKADISNKQLADVVEALIGAAYLEGKFVSAEKLIRYLEILPDGKRKVVPLTLTRDFSQLEATLGLKFRTPGWYVEAFLHGSAGGPRDYQRLECLGDALIDLIAMEYLYEKYPYASPGILSKLKSAAVNNRVQAFISVKLGLLRHLQYQNADLGAVLLQFESAVSALVRRRCLDIQTLPEQGLKVSADILEALFGAILLDYDYATAKTVFFRVAGDVIEAIASPDTVRTNPHTQFFEWAQRNKLTGVKIKRSLEKSPSGIDQYIVEVYFQGKLMGRATARSKLEASEKACYGAMGKIEAEWRRHRDTKSAS